MAPARPFPSRYYAGALSPSPVPRRGPRAPAPFASVENRAGPGRSGRLEGTELGQERIAWRTGECSRRALEGDGDRRNLELGGRAVGRGFGRGEVRERLPDRGGARGQLGVIRSRRPQPAEPEREIDRALGVATARRMLERRVRDDTAPAAVRSNAAASAPDFGSDTRDLPDARDDLGTAPLQSRQHRLCTPRKLGGRALTRLEDDRDGVEVAPDQVREVAELEDIAVLHDIRLAVVRRERHPAAPSSFARSSRCPYERPCLRHGYIRSETEQ